jgi:hypothetical protein
MWTYLVHILIIQDFPVLNIQPSPQDSGLKGATKDNGSLFSSLIIQAVFHHSSHLRPVGELCLTAGALGDDLAMSTTQGTTCQNDVDNFQGGFTSGAISFHGVYLLCFSLLYHGFSDLSRTFFRGG